MIASLISREVDWAPLAITVFLGVCLILAVMTAWAVIGMLLLCRKDRR